METYLSDSILALDNGENSFLLNGGGLDETITVDSSEHFLLETEVVELLD